MLRLLRFRHRTPAALPALLALLALLPVLALVPAGCERTQETRRTSSQGEAATPGTTQGAGGFRQAAQDGGPDGASGEPVILMLGDSLTAGHGLPAELAYPALIQQRLETNGYPHRVVNAGVSGDTSAGGLSRLDWLLRQRVDIMVLALGANDGLRGQDPDAMRANLAEIIERAQAKGISVILAGMRMPANYGLDYTRRFAAVFPKLAERYDLPLIPFLLDGVALNSDLNLGDGIHPNAEGQRILADNVWEVLEPVLER